MEKKGEAIESGCASIVAEPTPSYRIELPSSNFIPPVVATDSPSNTEAGTDKPGEPKTVLCKMSSRVGTIAEDQEPWEGRTWVVWQGQGQDEPEAVRDGTIWKPGDRVYYVTGRRCVVLGAIKNLVIIQWADSPDVTAAVNTSKLFLDMPKPERKNLATEVVQENNFRKLISQITSLLEVSGYEWDIEESLPEAKIKAIASGMVIGTILLFPEERFSSKHPDECPPGGCSGEWCWTLSPELYEYLDYEDRATLNELEDLTIEEVKFWKILEIQIDDVDFRHHVGKNLVTKGLASDYKIDAKTFALLVPERTNTTSALAEVDRMLDEVNSHQQDIPAKGSDRLPQLELFPNWGTA